MALLEAAERQHWGIRTSLTAAMIHWLNQPRVMQEMVMKNPDPLLCVWPWASHLTSLSLFVSW